ncbi:MAG: hypothetical protein N2C12_09885, partial [Planctomycetales bacterium]
MPNALFEVRSQPSGCVFIRSVKDVKSGSIVEIIVSGLDIALAQCLTSSAEMIYCISLLFASETVNVARSIIERILFGLTTTKELAKLVIEQSP